MTEGIEEIPRDRLALLGAPSARKSPEEFLASFDLADVSTASGCYIMADEKGKVIYVGKAKNLRSRVRQYINEQDSRYSVKFLMGRVAHIDFLITANEKEALLLENSLIKQFKPRYNVRLKDDKTYLSLRLDPREAYPRITVVRRYKKDGALYFGPYSSAQSVRETVRQIQRVFPLRTCSDHVLRNRVRPCIYYQMKQCVAPCVGYTDPEQYGEIVQQVAMVLNGRSDELKKFFVTQIEEHAEALEFEKAAAIRDRLYALRRTLEKQRMVAVPGAAERDVFGLYTQARYAEIQILFFRGGKMVGGRSFSFKQREMPLEEVLGSFLLQYYSEGPVIPSEVLIPLPLEEADSLGEILAEQRGAKVAVLHPQRGDKKALVELASRNAKTSFQEKRMAEKAQSDLLDQIREKLKLQRVPARIECFDISTHQGDKSVGSMVVFEGAEPNKARYRRYSIKYVEGQDDFAMMREVLMRRYKRAIEENDLPELVLIDGGKGQLNVATAVFADLGIEDLDVASIAKSRTEESGHSPERFFRPGRMNPIVLQQNSPIVHLLARVRDEAHRFAITYHRKRRRTAALRTPLLDVPGIGPARAKKLLTLFGSLARIRQSPVSDIAQVPGLTIELAKAIKGYLSVSTGGKSPGDH